MHAKISHSVHKKDLLLKRQEQQEETQQRQNAAMREARRLAEILCAEFGASTVFLIGPLTYNAYQDGMTLELAAEGIPAGVFGRALAHLKHISSLPVDVIDLSQADCWTRKSAAEKGKMLAKGA